MKSIGGAVAAIAGGTGLSSKAKRPGCVPFEPTFNGFHNYTFQYTNVDKEAMIRAMKVAMSKTQFAKEV